MMFVQVSCPSALSGATCQQNPTASTVYLPFAVALTYGLNQAVRLQPAMIIRPIFQTNVKFVIRITFNVPARVHLLRSSREACVQPAKTSLLGKDLIMSNLRLTSAAVLTAIVLAAASGAAHAMPVKSNQSVTPERAAASSGEAPSAIAEPEVLPAIEKADAGSSSNTKSTSNPPPAKKVVRRKTRKSRRHQRVAQQQFAGRCGGYKRQYFRTRRHHWLAKYQRCRGWR